MQIGFLSFGLTLGTGIILNKLAWRTVPILVYGLCVALIGIFCTKSFFYLDIFNGTVDNSFIFSPNSRSIFLGQAEV